MLTILNLKGGVGKTHTVRLFAGVRQERAKRILAIDADNQGNLTAGLLPVSYPRVPAPNRASKPSLTRRPNRLAGSRPLTPRF